MRRVSRMLSFRTSAGRSGSDSRRDHGASWVGVSAQTPGKHTALAAPSEATGAHKGQVLVMFAIFLIGMMGMLGLATDVGFSLIARRTAQGAADAGAFAGARMLAQYTTATPTRALSEVTAVVGQNALGPYSPTVYSCEYIGNNWNVVGTCGQTVPSNAAGARVRTRMTVPTWFIRVIPGAPDSVNVAGYAKARVQIAKEIPSDAPFIVCGPNAWDVTGNPTTTSTTSGTNLSIFSGSSINPNAVGRTFRIHDTQLDKKGNADCSSKDDQFKGLADGASNGSRSAGSWFKYSTGTTAGAVSATVDGAGGCSAGTTTPNGCVMILPVAATSPAETGTNTQLYVTGFAAFLVTTIDSNTHNATLLDDYIISGEGINNWCRDCGGTVVIRLIW